MADGGMRRSLVPGIALKVGFPLLIGLIALVSAQAAGMSSRNSLTTTGRKATRPLMTPLGIGASLRFALISRPCKISSPTRPPTYSLLFLTATARPSCAKRYLLPITMLTILAN